MLSVARWSTGSEHGRGLQVTWKRAYEFDPAHGEQMVPIAFSACFLTIADNTGVKTEEKKCIRASASSTNRSRAGHC